MTAVDYAIIAIIILSAILSIVRGFVREALSLAGWILAFWVALSFGRDLAVMLDGRIEDPSVRVVLAFVALFLAALLLTALVNVLAGQLVDKTGLSGTDRILGVVFGTIRGAVIVAILVYLGGFTPVPQYAWWSKSYLIHHHFEGLAFWLRGFLPPDMAIQLSY